MGSREQLVDPWGAAPGIEMETSRAVHSPSGERRLSLPAWARSPVAHLVPLRVFIGVGWLRAWIEKVTDPAWYDGEAIRSYVAAQIDAGAVLSPSYEWIMQSVWEPLAAVVGWVVLAAELAVGAGILFGISFNTALALGMVLNANFIASGTVAPSAFYMVIQTALLGSTVGEILSVDGWFHARTGRWVRPRWFFVGAAGWALVSAWALTNADTVGAGAVNDPGAVLAFDAALTAAASLLIAMRRAGA